MAGPDEPDPYKSDALEPDWPDASASPAAAAEAFLEQADETVISPPYRHAEEPPVEPAADPQDSVWPADAKAAKAMPGSAHRAVSSDSAAALANSAKLDAEPQAQRLARSEPSAPKEFWEHRPYPPEEAVSVPIKSGQAAAEASASQESPRLWEQTSAQPEQGSTAQEPPEPEKQEPHEQREEQPAVQAQRAEEPDAASESTAARTTGQSTKAAAEAAPDALAAPELLLQFSCAASP